MKQVIVGGLALSLHLMAFSAGNIVTAEPEVYMEIPDAVPFEGPGKYDENQAITVIEAHGYRHISELNQNDSGTWRGSAVRYGRTVNVEVDQQGNFYD